MKRAPKTLFILLALLCFAGLLKATLPQTSTGKWTSAVGLSEGRSSAPAVRLSDGRILITGGNGVNGPLQTAEFFATNGTVASAAAMNVARSSHFAVVLSDGRVLVGGGVSGGGTTNSAEIYDPATDSWTKTNAMAEARANATAALLADGRVLIAGGDNSGNASNTIEIFDPSNDSFSFAGTLSAARTKQAMATLQDGRVLIVGGFDGNNPLASSDIFDPSSGNISAGPSLATARYSASATTLLNGQVAVIGGAGSDGNGGTTDLASVEIFDASTGAFTTAGAVLTTAREAHQAYLLPKNNSVLIVGGTSSGSPVAASELFTPQASPSNGAWTYAITSTGSNVTPRSAATGSAMQQDGLLLAAGGTDASGNSLASTELYAFPTVKSDQADYPPGTTVNITGHGFQPGENVSITLVESPLFDTHGPYTVLADANGNISDSSFITDAHDVDIRFWLSAVGSQSGLVAQNTFKDGNATSVSGSVKSSATGNPAIVGATITCTSGCNNSPAATTTSGTGGDYVFENGTTKLSFGTNGPVTLQLTASATGFNSQTIALTGVNNGDALTGKDFTLTPAVVGTTTTIASAPNPSVYGSSVTFTATVTRASGSNTPGGTVAIKEGATTLCTTGSLSGSGGTATASCSVASLSVAGSPHTINAVYGGDTNFTGSTSTTPVSQTVTAKALTITGITASNKVYDRTTSATLNTGSATLVGVVSGDTVTLSTTGTTGTFSDKIVGTGKTVTVSGLTISGASASNYTLTQPTTTADITAKPLTVTGVTAVSKVYDRTTTATLSGTPALSGVISGDTVTLSAAGVSANFGDKNVGTAKPVTVTGYTIGGGDAGNYTVTQPTGLTADITAKPLTVTGVTAVSKVYDGNTTATLSFNGASLVGVISPDAVTINSTAAAGEFNNKNVGTTKPATVTGVALTGADAGNYTVSQPTGVTADITPKNLTVTGATANNKIYDRTVTATVNFGSASLTGVISPDMVTINSSGVSAEFTDKNVGTGKPVTVTGVALSGTDAGNYTVSQPAGLTANITALHITGGFTAQSKQYDGNASETVLTRSLSGTITGDAVSLYGGTASFSDKNVGTGKTVTLTGATLAGADAGNYILDSVPTTTADITALHITGSFTAKSKQYDGNTSGMVLTRSLSGAITGDVVSLYGGTASFSDKNVGTGKTVTLTGASLAGADAGNYILDSVGTTTADITALHITGSFTAQSKQYDGNASATVLTRSFSGTITGDAVSLYGGTAMFSDKTVGNGRTVTLTGASLAGADAGNYILDSVATTTADITALHITGSFTAQSKQYDGNASATVLTRSLNATITGDVVSLYGGTASFSDKNVGTGKTVTLTGATLAGADAGNYILDSVATTTASITARPITVSANANTKVYDGTTSAAAIPSVTSGTIATGDTPSFTEAYATRNAGTGLTLVPSGSVNDGDGGNNYYVTFANSTAGVISQRPISVTAQPDTKTFDGGTTSNVAPMISSGVMPAIVAGDAAMFTQAFNSANAGARTLVPSGSVNDGNSGLNYAVTFVNAAGTINAAPTSTSVTAAPNPSTLGQSVTFTATVANTSTTPVPTGSVQFVIDSVNYGAAVPLTGGSAGISTSSLAAGPHTITANYINSDGNFKSSSGSVNGNETINFGFLGLFAPYQPPSAGVAYKINSAIPLKWQYTNNGGAVVNSSNANPAVLINVAPCTTGTDGDVIVVSDAGASGYQYDPTTNTWQFNWKTTGMKAGCYNIYIQSTLTGQKTGPFPIQLR